MKMKITTHIKPNESTVYFQKDRTVYDRFLCSLEEYAKHRFKYEYGCDIPSSFETRVSVRIICKNCEKSYSRCKCEKEKK